MLVCGCRELQDPVHIMVGMIIRCHRHIATVAVRNLKTDVTTVVYTNQSGTIGNAAQTNKYDAAVKLPDVTKTWIKFVLLMEEEQHHLDGYLVGC